MKPSRPFLNTLGVLACIAALLLCALTSGCATTSIRVTTPSGLVVDAKFPKNLQATNLDLTLDGIGHLKADRITTDASSVIDAQGAAASGVADSLTATAGL